jgi:phosphate transport system substrate-binding protein
MQAKTTAFLLVTGAAILLGTRSCLQAQETIKIDGSSTVYPATEAVAEEFLKANKGIKVTVGISGTGGGFKRFVRGELDIADASRPISKSEMEAAHKAGIEYVELPICFDALTVAIHPSNDWAATMTTAELKKIWEPGAQGKILRWNQIRPEWPDQPLALFGAGSDSGTFDYFTEAICDKAKASRGDFTASEDDNVLVRGIGGNKYALGYLPYSYFAANLKDLKAVAIDWDKDKEGAVLPSPENVAKGIYNPLSRPLFLYVSKKSAARPEVKQFVEFYLENAGTLVKEVKYLPLPEGAYAVCKERFKKLETGTGFGGEPAIGLPVEEVLKRKPVHVVEATEKKAEKG